MSVILGFFSALFYISFTQNLVFSGGYGASEVIRTAARPKQLLVFVLSITYFSIVTAIVSRLFLFIPALKAAMPFVNIIMFVIILVAVYFVTVGLIGMALKHSSWKDYEKEKYFRQIGISAFNTIVLAIPFISQKIAYSVFESVGAGLGAGVAFALATTIMHMGMRRIEANQNVLKSFKGTPAVFLYMGILALAFTGFAGKSLFF